MTTLLKMKEVKIKTSLNKTDIYNKMKEGTFPKNVKTSLRSVAWVESEIEAWVQETIAKSRLLE